MTIFLALLFSAQWQVGAAEQSDPCPFLPEDSGYEWTYREGPDFDLCYGQKPGEERIRFGVYFGNAPTFRHEKSETPVAGIIAGRAVQWFPSHNKDEASPFARETLLVMKQGSKVAHIWILADSEDELAGLKAMLAKIAFKPEASGS